MGEIEDELKAEALRPRRGFLVAAAVAIFLAFFAYFFEDDIVASSSGGQLTFAFLLIFLVLAAMLLVLCYRSPHIGNRLLGYDVVITKPDKGVKSDVQYSGGFKAETGLETKRMNTRRKQARYSRRKLAETTRQMQQEQPASDDIDSKN